MKECVDEAFKVCWMPILLRLRELDSGKSDELGEFPTAGSGALM